MRLGGWAWVGLTAYIALADAWLIRRGEATMSEVFGDMLKHPAKRLPILLVWGIVTVHLFAVLVPDRLRRRWSHMDPIGGLARLIEKSAPRG